MAAHYLGAMRRGALLLLACGLLASASAQHPAVQQAIDAVSADSLAWRLQRLSGEAPVDTGTGDLLILSRHKSRPGNALAAQWIRQEFIRMGYAPAVQAFGATGENVLAMKPGAVHPERKVIICAHYDCMPAAATAPGADDDGSGACAVLEAARVLAPHAFENTVVFALWDEEEQGLVGSGYHAAAAAGNDEDIAGVVAMDAIGYDGDGDGLMRIHTRPIGNSIAIKDSALMVNAAYGLGLPIAINDPGATYSDHASFWTRGYGAILVIEDFDQDPNPYYHTANDRLQHLDTAYWRGLARLAIGTAAVLAVPMGPSGSADALPRPALRVWPNPARAQGEVRVAHPFAAPASAVILDALGKPVRTAALAGPDAAIGLGGLAAGTYLVRAMRGGEAATARLVVLP